MNFFGPLLIVLAAGAFLLTSSPAWSAGDQQSSPPAHRPVDRGHRREGSGAHREGPAYRSAGPVAAAGRASARRRERAVSHRPRRDRGVAGARPLGRGAGHAAGRRYPRLAQVAGQGTRPGSRPPGARPGVLRQGRGHAGHAAFRAGSGGQTVGAGGAQRQPGSSRRCGRASAGACAWAWRSRRTAMSVPVRGSERS